MISKERLENIKENVYMRSEIAKISRIGIDTSLKEELELIEEIDRLNNIIKDLLKDIEVIVECEDINIIKMQLINCLYKLNELKENKK